MYTVQLYDQLSESGLDKFSSEYQLGNNWAFPDVVLLRSFDLANQVEFVNGFDRRGWPELKAVGRAGIGVNNIPVDQLTAAGIPVFNTPGANSNAVKELVIAGLFLATRNILQASEFVQQLDGTDTEIGEKVEVGKKQFKGRELAGRTLGIVGLGSIGAAVANAAVALGVKVVGYDEYLTVDNALHISPEVRRVHNLYDVLLSADFLSLHVPLNDETRNMINQDALRFLQDGVTILNFARKGIIDEMALCEELRDGRVHTYVCDFPSNALKEFGPRRVIALPHLGASTEEANDNCTTMVVDQIRKFIEYGNIENSVNFPTVVVPSNTQFRLVIAHKNVRNILNRIMAMIEHNIEHMVNKSRNEIAYTVIDTDYQITNVEAIRAIPEVLSARNI